jgi:hypothetical protein
MTSDEIGACSSGFERSPGSNRRRKNSRLGVYSQSQFVVRSLEAKGGHFDPKNAIRFFKDLTSRRLRLSQLSSHTDLLRTLSWKYESGLHRSSKQKQMAAFIYAHHGWQRLPLPTELRFCR